jgi:hypothetical protein
MWLNRFYGAPRSPYSGRRPMSAMHQTPVCCVSTKRYEPPAFLIRRWLRSRLRQVRSVDPGWRLGLNNFLEGSAHRLLLSRVIKACFDRISFVTGCFYPSRPLGSASSDSVRTDEHERFSFLNRNGFIFSTSSRKRSSCYALVSCSTRIS